MRASASLATLPSPREKKARLDGAKRIRVVVRKRPLVEKELDAELTDVLELRRGALPSAVAPNLLVHEGKSKLDGTPYTETHQFRFDSVFEVDSSNARVYTDAVQPLVDRLFAGVGHGATSNTIFAYGATGSGKTHTLMGYHESPGMYLLAAADIFKRLGALKGGAALQLVISSYEIYGGKVFDLLNERSVLPVREDGKKKVNVVGLTQVTTATYAEFHEALLTASDARSTAVTGVHDQSSRSHAVLQLVLRPAAEKKPDAVAGRLSFVDLAGTERGRDTLNCTDKERQLEGAEINKSLLALKECIRSLDLGKAHIPFRGSKLTEVLRESFVGDSHTLMIGNVSPCSDSVEQTLNTLRYAAAVRDFSRGTTTAAVAANGGGASQPQHHKMTPGVIATPRATSVLPGAGAPASARGERPSNLPLKRGATAVEKENLSGASRIAAAPAAAPPPARPRPPPRWRRRRRARRRRRRRRGRRRARPADAGVESPVLASLAEKYDGSAPCSPEVMEHIQRLLAGRPPPAPSCRPTRSSLRPSPRR